MSRARPFYGPDGTTHWFDRHNNSRLATSTQLELLADVEGIEIDDLLDEDLTQAQVADRIHAANGNLVPDHVLEARRLRKIERDTQPECRICAELGTECDGRITRHHFVPRWLMRELENYQAYSARSQCTIPACVGRHRDLHYRGEDAIEDKSIVRFLTKSERAFAQKMLDELHEQRPKVFELMLGGNASSYEYQLVRDYMLGHFREVVETVAEPATPAVSGAVVS